MCPGTGGEAAVRREPPSRAGRVAGRLLSGSRLRTYVLKSCYRLFCFSAVRGVYVRSAQRCRVCRGWVKGHGSFLPARICPPANYKGVSSLLRGGVGCWRCALSVYKATQVGVQGRRSGVCNFSVAARFYYVTAMSREGNRSWFLPWRGREPDGPAG